MAGVAERARGLELARKSLVVETSLLVQAVAEFQSTVAITGAQNAFTAVFIVVSDQLLSAAEYTLTSVIADYVAGASLGGQTPVGCSKYQIRPPSARPPAFRASQETHLL